MLCALKSVNNSLLCFLLLFLSFSFPLFPLSIEFEFGILPEHSTGMLRLLFQISLCCEVWTLCNILSLCLEDMNLKIPFCLRVGVIELFDCIKFREHLLSTNFKVACTNLDTGQTTLTWHQIEFSPMPHRTAQDSFVFTFNWITGS